MKSLMVRLAFGALLGVGLSLSPAARAERSDATVIVGQIASPQLLDPHRVTSMSDFRVLVNIYDGLVRYKKGTLELEPALAESWSISEDGQTYIFKLRDGVTFHDGAPVDAEAVKFNIDRMIFPDHPYHGTGPFPLAFFFTVVDEVRVIDRLTVEFELTAPFAPFLSNLAYPAGLLVSPKAVAEHGAAFADNPSGAGPFRFVGREADGGVRLARNDAYWDGAPAVEEIVFRPIAEAAGRLAALKAGELDIAVEIGAESAGPFDSSADFYVREQTGPHLWFVMLNTRTGPFRSRAIRQAVNYAVNKPAIADDLLHGGAEIAAGPIAPAFGWAHDAELAPYQYDPDRARALLELGGYAGEEVVFLVAESGSGMLAPTAMGQAIREDLEAVGMNVRIETLDWVSYLQRVNGGLGQDADMAQMAWMTNDPDTLLSLALRGSAWPERGGFNSGYYCNPAADRLIDHARRTSDQALRQVLYRDVQAYIAADAPWLFFGSWRQMAVAARRIDGFELEPSFFLLLKDIEVR